RADRVRIARVERQEPHHVLARCRRVQLLKRRPVPRRVHDRLPLAPVPLRQVEHQILVHVDEPRHVLRPLDIPPHPVNRVRHAAEQRLGGRDHWHCCCPPCCAASTHVSLLPPPCDEFTTSDPFRIAT